VTIATLTALADLLRERNAIDERISQIIQRPMTAGHAGEWIASRIFDVKLELSATVAAYDGKFRSGPLAGKTVNVKWYLKREGVLDMQSSPTLDYYLVMTGPRAAPISSKAGTRPWRIDSVYLFNSHDLLAEQQMRGVKIGIATSVREAQWSAAEIYPKATCQSLIVSPEQAALLRLFG
jgi:hypothetical protein